MNILSQDAERIGLLFHYGVVDAPEVITWADAMIARMDSPPDALLELSTTAPRNTAEIISRLNQLSAGVDFWIAFRSALPQIHDHCRRNPKRAADIAHHMFATACKFGSSNVPDDLRFIVVFDDSFSLANQGVLDPEKVYRKFLQELDKFKGTGNALGSSHE